MGDLLNLLQWGDTGWLDEIAAGTLVTVALTVATLPVGFIGGFLLALARQSQDPLVRLFARVYATLFRGLPELLTLFVVYYGSQAALSWLSRALFNVPLDINPFVAGVIALGLVLSGFAAEVFLSAFRAIPRGQYEAAAALGLHRARALRLIVLPQLIRLALPGLSNLWLNVMKDTALVSAISLNDLLRQTAIAVGSTKEPFFFYAVACLIYLALSLLSSLAHGRVEVWASRGGQHR